MINLYDPIINKEDILSVLNVLNKKWLSGNTEINKEFEKKLSEFLQVKYVSTCSSGTTGLHLALLGLGVGKNDEVIVPSLSYIASANAVTYLGAKPKFIDVDKKTWQMDTSKLRSAITSKTKAIMPVHLYGGVPDLKNISDIAKEFNLKIIHDSAEALGSKYSGKSSLAFRDVSVLSFFPNKLITTGEGGAVVTNNKKVYDLIEKLKSQGLEGKREYYHSDIGFNYRMSAMSAALGLTQISRINDYLTKKKEINSIFKFELEKLGFKFQEFNYKITSSFWLNVAIVPEGSSRDKLKKYLIKNGIETRNVFVPIHLQPPYIKKMQNKNFKVSEYISKNGICFPSSPSLKFSEIKHIIKIIKNFY